MSDQTNYQADLFPDDSIGSRTGIKLKGDPQ
jgi:hypothetical protein